MSCSRSIGLARSSTEGRLRAVGSTASRGSRTALPIARAGRWPACRWLSRTSSAREGVPSQSGSRILEGYLPPYTATVVSRLTNAWCGAAREDQPGRVRDGLLHGELRVRSHAQPLGQDARARRLLRRERRGSRRGHCAVGARHGHRRLDPPAGGAVRDRRAETHIRLGLPLRHDRVRVLARSGGAADARRDRRGAAAQAHGRPRSMRRDLAGAARRDRAAQRRAPGPRAHRRPQRS